MKIDNKIKSVLKLENLIINKIEFERGLQDIDQNELSVKINHNISFIKEDEIHRVDLMVAIEDENELFRLKLNLSGLFSVDMENIDEEMKESLLKRNTLSILFPYLRTQISLITTQPGMKPIILPPININALLENKEDEV